MKNRTLPFFAMIFCSVMLSLVLATTAVAHPSGSPAGYTGSPGDGQHCVSCHNGNAVTVSGWITSNIPTQGYTPGSVYTITVTVSGSGKKGFEVSPQSATGAQLGVLAAGSGNHLTGGTKYVTQSSAGSTSSTVIWNFTWTAPTAGTGQVTFYGAFTVGKSNTKLSTLLVGENTAIPLTASASSAPSVICVGQTSQLNATPAGGSGTYTYAWTSVPAGFTSSLQNPVVSPTISTQYNVHVSDGTNSADAPANVTVNQPATAAAGNDTTCAFITVQVPVNGTATNFSTVLWTTSGTGTFSAAGSLTGNYQPSAVDKTGGSITLTLTASAQSPCVNQADDSRIIHFDGPTGIENAAENTIGVVISPNPSAGFFALKLTGSENLDAMITISDITGRTVLHRAVHAFTVAREQFEMTGSPAGLYFIRIQTTGGSVVRKLVIE